MYTKSVEKAMFLNVFSNFDGDFFLSFIRVGDKKNYVGVTM